MKLQEIIKLELVELRKWIESAFNKDGMYENFNWLGLAEALYFDATQGNLLNERIGSAELSVKIYDWLASKSASPASSGYETSAIALRVYMISNGFVEINHPILGISQIIKSFRLETTLTMEEALTVVKNIRDKVKNKSRVITSDELQHLQKLRILKNKLNLIKDLPSDNNLLQQPEIQAWLKVREALP